MTKLALLQSRLLPKTRNKSSARFVFRPTCGCRCCGSLGTGKQFETVMTGEARIPEVLRCCSSLHGMHGTLASQISTESVQQRFRPGRASNTCSCVGDLFYQKYRSFFFDRFLRFFILSVFLSVLYWFFLCFFLFRIFSVCLSLFVCLSVCLSPSLPLSPCTSENVSEDNNYKNIANSVAPHSIVIQVHKLRVCLSVCLSHLSSPPF